MQKTNKKKLEEFIRVDHAGERGAIKIYEGQLLALNTIYKDNQLKEIIEEMREHEREHCDYFENEIKKREIKPTKFLPLWDLLGVGLGFGTTLLGKKAAMLCTASVEEVIDKHYQDQINQIKDDEKELRDKIIKFREDELHHKDIAYEKGASKEGFYSILDKVIKEGILSADINLNFDSENKIKNNYIIKGFVKNGNLGFINKYEFKDLDFEFNITSNQYLFNEIESNFNEIGLISPLIEINKAVPKSG